MADYITIDSNHQNGSALQTWSPAQAITADKMNTISYAAYVGDNYSRVNKERLDSLANIVGYTAQELASGGSVKTRISDLSSAIANADLAGIATVRSQIADIESQITAAYNAIPNISPALTSLAAMIVWLNNQRINGDNSLSTSIAEVSQIASTASNKATANESAINTAKGTFSSLANRLTDMTGNINTNHTDITTMQAELSDAKNSSAKNQNFTSLDLRLEAIESEIVGARGSSSVATIDDRLDNIESTAQSNYNNLNTAITNGLSSLSNDVVHTSQIYPDLDKNTQGYVLDATQGKALKDLIDGLDAAYKAADAALETSITSAYGAADAVLQSAITTAYQAADSALNTKIETIAAELGMLDDGAISGLNSRVDTAESNITTLQGNITTINTALDGKASSSDLTTLAGRVTSLENNPQSATVVIEQVTYDNNGIPTSISSPSADVDYLLKKDDNYYYWKYINNTWQLISGGGEGGTSSAEFYAALTDAPENPSETVDYFIGTGSNYIHYRWYNNQWVQILPNNLINNVTVDISVVGEGENPPTKSRPVITAVGSNTNLLADFNAIQSIDYVTTDAGTTLSWTNIDGEVQEVTITGGGGGGSSSNINAFINRVTAKETNGALTTISGEECIINYVYSATERVNDQDELIATTGSGVWSINGARVATQEVTINDTSDESDYNTFDIGQYLRTGTNNITLKVSIVVNDETINRTKTWVVTVVNFSLVWEYEESTINSGSTINFLCTPYGQDITKTLYLKVGQYQQTQTVTTSSTPTTVTLVNNFEHGSYTAEMWMTATINGVSKETPHITHDFLVVEAGNNTPIIAATLPSSTIDQYNTISIPFVVYTPNSSLSTVTLSVDGVVQDTRTEVNRNTQTWNYTPSTSGAKVLTIASGTASKTLNLTVNSVNINNVEIGGYTFKLKANELASNGALQNWHYDNANVNATKLQFSNNFDWINGGIKTEYDENNQLRQYIRIKSGTTMTIPYKMFATDPKRLGSNFKIIFKIENCRNYDAVVATTMADNIGIQLNAHNAIFKSNTTSISTQYGENEYTELEFEVYKNHVGDTEVEAANPYMMAWIDGVMTSARPYDGNFVQNTPADIVIGSDDCDVCVYLVKYYPNVLAIADHITNFIADAPNAAEMVRRYNRNDILDQDGDIDFEALANKNPDCRVWLYDIPRMTTGKKDYVSGVGFQQFYKNGTAYQNGLRGVGTLTVQGTSSVNYRKGAANTDINFYDTKDEGRLALCELYDGENNDLLYNTINGETVAKPENEQGFKINTNSTPITYSNMKVNFASCEQVNNMCNAEWYQQFQPYPSLSPRDCMEFAMGVQFIHDKGLNEPSGEVILFNEKGANRNPNKYYMYSIGNLGTSKKNTHIFHSDNECCVEVNNNENAGCRMVSVPSDLQDDYTAYLNENYEGMSNYDWSGDIDGKDHSYGMRFPDTKKPAKEIKAGWARFVKWMADNNPNAATNASIASETYAPYTFKGHKRTGTQVLQGTTVSQYAGTYTTDSFERRMAKMLSECEDYMAMDSVIYHFLFIERHTMVDNVSKNTFWSAEKTNQYINGVEQSDTEGYWIWDLSKNYDNDTSDGNNNEGQLIFDYGNEATDRQDGKPVFNASDAVWFVFASNLYEACQTMFQNREGATSKNGKWHNAWNASAYHAYLLEEQRKVPERVWNECYWYDYLRTFETGKVHEASDEGQIIDKSWITFLDGGQKTHQRAHYETFEELYDASKYRSNFSTANSITLRGYTPDDDDPSLLAVPAKSEIAIKMYNKCYLTAHFGNNIQTQKVQKGVLTTLQFLEDGEYMTLSDTVINVDTASMIQEIGDLAPLYPGQASFSAAIRLRSIKVGDSTAGYNNPHITNTETGTVDFGANYMLEHLEVQNLSNANQPLNLNGCPALTYLDARGSTFTSITFANGGLLEEAYINNPTSLVMRNLDFLTTANFHLTSPTSVTQLRLEGCKLFDKQSFIEGLTNLNVLRLTGITWSLSNSSILDSLLGIMGMDELGYTIPQSYLAGTISLLGTVYQGTYNDYLAAWSPDLTIDVSQSSFVYQHLVIYQNDDGNELYRTYIDNNSYLIDPYATGLLQSTPTKDADIQYIYTFGKIDSAANYIPFSGWREISKSESIYDDNQQNTNPNIKITSPTTLVAVYRTTPQSYTVRWLVRENQVVATAPGQRYGGGLDLIAPTIKEVQTKYPTYTFNMPSSGNLCTYSIMTGWEKLPINITPTAIGATYDIYATWLERTNVDYQTVLSSDEYSVEEKLLVLKEISSARSTIDVGDKYDITLGYNGVKAPDYELANAPKRFTGSNTETLNDYTPFAINQTFTMMIDYKFEPQTSTKDELILLSCYENNNDSSQGFKLFYKPNNMVPQISLGSTAQSTTSNVCPLNSNLSNRGIIVIRRTLEHPDQLYIYTGSDSGGLKTTYSRDAFKTTLTWSAIGSNAKIVIGGINTSDTSVANATGTLYSVKYWNEDLGEGECLQLASWCHENMTFAIADYTEADVHSSKNETLTSTLVLHTLNASQMGTVTEPAYSAARIGWDPSTVRDFYNNRIYNGFPTLLQSIMAPVSITHRKAYRDTNEGRYVIENTGSNTTQDYVFAPSRIEVGGYNANYTIEASGQFSWCSGSQMKVMYYNNNNLQEVAGNINYTNLRFPYCYNRLNNTDVTIYINYPQEGRSFYEWADEHITGGLKIGDILIPQDSSVAYIYVPSTEINKGAPVTTDNYTCLSNTIGGWITSTGWWTRSVIASAYQSTIAKFIYVTNSGAVVGDEGGRINTHGLVYSIGL